MKDLAVKVLIFVVIYLVFMIIMNLALPNITTGMGRIVSGLLAAISLVFAELIMKQIKLKRGK